MKPDPALDRTRDARTEISREHGNDIRRLGEFYIEYQRQFGDRLRWADGSAHEPEDPALHATEPEPPVVTERQR